MRTYLVRYEDCADGSEVVTTHNSKERALDKVVDLMLDKDFKLLNIIEIKFDSQYPSNTPELSPMDIDITGSHFALKYLPKEGK